MLRGRNALDKTGICRVFGEPASPSDRHHPNRPLPPKVQAMPYPKRIETERLLLRWSTAADAEEIFARYANDPVVTKYLSWSPHKSIRDTRAFLETRRADQGIFNWLVFLRDDFQLLGSIGCQAAKHVVQFGYCYAADAWGRGYATEAAQRMVQVWLENPTVWRVQAFCDPENVASAHVLEKAGLTYEGTLRKCTIAPNLGPVPRDVRCYAIVRE
jgi:RimJ/RimL family protein N-acetyltransferase